MRTVEAEMRSVGASDEQIARVLVPMRNAAKVTMRGPMNPVDVAKIEARNMKIYNDPVGPTADYQYAKYGSWREVIKAAYRTNPEIDAMFGFGSDAPIPPSDPEPLDPPIDPLP